MNVQEQIAKLESLLDRVRRNAGRPHGTVAGAAVPAVVAPPPARPAAIPMTAVPVVEEALPRSAIPAAARAEVNKPAREVPAEATTEFEELDMMEAEIVELGGETDARAARASEPPAGTEIEIDLSGTSEEEIPESAPRAAPAREAAQLEELEHEPPIKTPPPESGRQIMAPAPAPSVTYREELEAEEADLAGGSDVDSLLEADLSGGPIPKAPPGFPTMEQVGDTVELEGADEPPTSLELDAPLHGSVAPDAPVDELELALPKAEFGGGYDATLAPPTQASDDLERHDREIEAIIAPPPASQFGVSVPPSGPVSVAAATLAAPLPIVPILVERPAAPDAHVAHMIAAPPPAKIPDTFLELLDASLGLRP